MPDPIILWIVCGLVVVFGCAVVMLRRRPPIFDVRPVEFAMETVDALPTVSLAALLLEPPRLTADGVAQACEKAWGEPFNHSEHDVRFVIGEPPVLMIRDGRLYYMLNSGDEPYLDNHESNLARVDDAELRNAAQRHRGWISMDYLEESEQWPEMRAVARANIAKLFGELLSQLQPLAIVHPADDRAVPWSDELGKRLHAGQLDEKG